LSNQEDSFRFLPYIFIKTTLKGTLIEGAGGEKGQQRSNYLKFLVELIANLR